MEERRLSQAGPCNSVLCTAHRAAHLLSRLNLDHKHRICGDTITNTASLCLLPQTNTVISVSLLANPGRAGVFRRLLDIL